MRSNMAWQDWLSGVDLLLTASGAGARSCKFALTMSPEQAEAVALRLYVDMLEAGFTRVGEFHYLHHDRDGTPYGNISEMADRIVSAAGAAGIGLTLLPVFYAHSTFGGAAPNEGQRRFINDEASFARLIEGCQKALVGFDGAVLGVARTACVLSPR